MKVLIAVGGGGHFSPALAVIEQMPRDWEVVLVGRKYAFEGDEALSFEYQTAKRLGLPFEVLITGRLQRKFTLNSVTSLLKVPFGLTQAYKIIEKCRPDVILSFGGYVSVPVVIAAAFKKIPIVIHEQTLHAGLANKIAARYATKICLSWEESQKYFPKEKSVLTGNPLRKEFLQKVSGVSKAKRDYTNKALDTFDTRDTSGPLIYVTGGSGGAHGINVLIEGCLGKLLAKYTIIHQTGDARQFGDFARLEKAKMELPQALQKRYTLKKFLTVDEVLKNLQQSDLVISRAGINTVTELLFLGKSCLLIPLPYGQHNEQLENAQFVKEVGLAEVMNQLEATPDLLFQKIADMMEKKDSYQKHKEKAQKLIHLDAAEKIVKEVEYAKEKRIAA